MVTNLQLQVMDGRIVACIPNPFADSQFNAILDNDRAYWSSQYDEIENYLLRHRLSDKYLFSLEFKKENA